MSGGVDIRVRFDRLAQAVRGVFLLGSADGDPHQVRIESPELLPGGRGPAHAVNLEPIVVDLQPGRDLVVPFDIRYGHVPRGAYTLRARVTIDGMPADEIRADVKLR